MALRSIHTRPFNGSWRDALSLAKDYTLPELIFVMVAAFAISFTWFLVLAAKSFHHVSNVDRSLGTFYFSLTVVFVAVGDVLFALLIWSFLRAVATSAGYVPAEPWRHVPRVDTREQRRVAEQRARQQHWLEWNRYQMAVKAHQHRVRFLQQVMGVSAPAMYLEPPPQAAQPLSKPVTPGIIDVEAASRDGKSPSSSAAEATVAIQESPQPSGTRMQSNGCNSGNGNGYGYGGPAATAASERMSVAPMTAAGINNFKVREFEADGSLRYCHRCAQFKPDGCHHCRFCDKCTVFMDHHCLYLNNCIGLKNYKYFFLTLTYGTACGWICSTMFLSTFRALKSVTPCAMTTRYKPTTFSGTYYDFVQQLGQVTEEVQRSYWWLIVPASMLLVNVLVFYLWRQHVDLIVRGRTTLERMREVSVERFLYAMNLTRYGRCAPQTNRWCAMIAEAKERARCLLHRVHSLDQDEDTEYAKMMARGGGGGEVKGDDKGARNAPHDFGDAYEPSLIGVDREDMDEGAKALEEDPSGPSLLASGPPSPSDSIIDGDSRKEENRKKVHRRRCFGEPTHWWEHLLPLAPRRTGEAAGLAETAPPVTKHL